MSTYGLRGPFVDFIFTGVRLCVDQTLENATGAGALPWTWPVNEQVLDIVHKGVYAFITGYVSLYLVLFLVHLTLLRDVLMRDSCVIGGCSEMRKESRMLSTNDLVGEL